MYITRHSRRYILKRMMRKIVFGLTIIFSSACHSIGWEELNLKSANKRGIVISWEFVPGKGCYSVTAKFPNTLKFPELGLKSFSGIRLRTIPSKNRGWQLYSDGNEISVSSVKEENYEKMSYVCLTAEFMTNGYISATYWQEATPPMVVIIPLSEGK